MGRIEDVYQRREFHIGVVSALMFVTNCRYIGTNQLESECAILPLMFQCIGTLAFLLGSRLAATVVRVCQVLIVMGAAVSIVFSVVYIHDMLQCTVSILNAYALTAISIELRAVHSATSTST